MNLKTNILYIYKSMSSDFPFRTYTDEEIKEDLKALISLVSRQVASVHIKKPNSCGYVGANRFFQYERMNTPSQGKESAISQWNSKRDEIISYYEKNGTKDLFRSIVFWTKCPNEFSPHVSAGVYRYFNATHIVDWFAGWGNRLYGAVAYGCRYTGYDSNPNLLEPYQKMIEYYQPYAKKLEFHCMPAQQSILEEGCDLVFSSPPFWKRTGKLVESYNNCETNYDIFLKDCLFPLLSQARERRVPVALFIPDEMASKIDVFEKHSFFLTFGNDKIFCWDWKGKKDDKKDEKKDDKKDEKKDDEDVQLYMKTKLLSYLRTTIYWEPILETKSISFLQKIVSSSNL